MKKILLVEDDPFLSEIYTIKFKEKGYDVKVAMEGEECLNKLKEERPDLIILDIVLPNYDGWEILRKIKKDEQLKDIKVVILSNLDKKEEVDKGSELGALKFLMKSRYTPSEVVVEIEKILNE